MHRSRQSTARGKCSPGHRTSPSQVVIDNHQHSTSSCRLPTCAEELIFRPNSIAMRITPVLVFLQLLLGRELNWAKSIELPTSELYVYVYSSRYTPSAAQGDTFRATPLDEVTGSSELVLCFWDEWDGGSDVEEKVNEFLMTTNFLFGAHNGGYLVRGINCFVVLPLLLVQHHHPQTTTTTYVVVGRPPHLLGRSYHYGEEGNSSEGKHFVEIF